MYRREFGLGLGLVLGLGACATTTPADVQAGLWASYNAADAAWIGWLTAQTTPLTPAGRDLVARVYKDRAVAMAAIVAYDQGAALGPAQGAIDALFATLTAAGIPLTK